MSELHRTRSRIKLGAARFQFRKGSRRLRSVLDALTFDTSVSHLGAGSFPDPLVPGVVTELRTDVGELYVHADDLVMTPFIREHGSWEASEGAFIRRAVREGATFVDVGANVGYFSVLGSTLVGPSGHVVAVEPEARNLGLLRANLWRHGAGNAVVLPIAAHRHRGFVPLRLNEQNRGDHQVGWHEGASAFVPCARLDDLLAGVPVDFIKVDTQGVDHDVIAGLTGLIDQNRPLTILCEFWIEGMEERGLDPDAIARDYRALGFELALLDDAGSSRPASPGDLVQAATTSSTRFVNVVLQRH